MKRIPLIVLLFLSSLRLRLCLSLSLCLSLCLSLFLSLLSFQIKAQNVSINNAGAPAHATAMLDVSSNDKGILIPRMLTPQRESILNPAQGLMVYDIDTRSFWYFDGAWKEMMTDQDLNGQAGGDLIGSYPNPQVVKIQSLDVAYGTPEDKQVLKWDETAQNWAGRNDSLFLPHNAVASDPQKLFSITNNWNGFSYSTAILGRRAGGSGLALPSSTGLWGDGGSGAGVTGTSNTHAGLFGRSVTFHGIHGQSDAGDKSGVYGENTAAGGTGVLGQSQTGFGIGGLTNGNNVAGVIGTNQHSGDNVYGVIGLIENATGGAAVFGKNNANSGHAGLFTSAQLANTHPALKASAAGTGAAGYFVNTSNGPAGVFEITENGFTRPAIEVNHLGDGDGLSVELLKPSAGGSGVNVVTQGNGTAVYGRSHGGHSGQFVNLNTTNPLATMSIINHGLGNSLIISSLNSNQNASSISITHSGGYAALNSYSTKGSAGRFELNNATTFNPALLIENEGKGAAISVQNHNTTSQGDGVSLLHKGIGEGMRITLNNASNPKAGLYILSDGDKGAEIHVAGSKGLYAKTAAHNGVAVHGYTGSAADNAVAVKGETGTGGLGSIGVLGIGANGDNQAIGVKGINYSPNSDYGAVTGVNESTGIGVYGEVTGAFGFGVAGISGQNNQNAHSGLFRNYYANSTAENVQLITNGKGTNLYLQNSNLTNPNAQFRISHAGTGDFIRLENNLGNIKTTINKDGHITTDGTLTVKENKGIVRNSTASQLRVEEVTAVWDPDVPFAIEPGTAGVIDNITFSTPFSSPPAVYVANATENGWYATRFSCTVWDVTTTGCKMTFYNVTNYNVVLEHTEWKLVAMGTE